MTRPEKVEFWLFPYKPVQYSNPKWYYQVIDLKKNIVYENILIREHEKATTLWLVFGVFEVQNDGWLMPLWIEWKDFKDAVTGYQQQIRHHIVRNDPNVEFVAVYYGEELEKVIAEKEKQENDNGGWETTETKAIHYKQEWDQIMAHFDDFINIQESIVWFGDTEEQAKENLLKAFEMEKAKPQPAQYKASVIICVMIDELPNEIATLELKSIKPFTKDHLDKFTQSESFTNTISDALQWDLKDMEIRVFVIIKNL